jgi:hypothetical protein
MRPSLRFLALAVVGWAGVRAATLDRLPGVGLFAVPQSEAKPSPIQPTQFPAIQPVEPYVYAESGYYPASYYPYAPATPQTVVIRPVVLPISYPAAYGSPVPRGAPSPSAMSAPAFDTPIVPIDQWSLAGLETTSRTRRSVAPQGSPPAPQQVSARPLDRIQLSSWAFLRSQPGGLIGPSALARGGQLGASQAGARLLYNVNRQIAVALRTSADVGRRGGEVAGGLRVQPVTGLPLWFTAERRQSFGSGSGRDAFALFAEAGIYRQSLPWQLTLEGYAQGGIVGLRSRDAFADGGLALTRPLIRNLSIGAGAWGGVQPGLYRVDAGPRLTMRVRPNVRVHLDWRQRLAGNVQPGSGPAITLAGDF